MRVSARQVPHWRLVVMRLVHAILIRRVLLPTILLLTVGMLMLMEMTSVLWVRVRRVGIATIKMMFWVRTRWVVIVGPCKHCSMHMVGVAPRH